MTTTTLALLALAGGLSSGTIPSGPSWQTDYAQALTRASAERKPMAVFIGHGADRFKTVLAEGTVLPADAAKLLQNSYVCMYLDTDTAAGKELAGRFALAGGLVISSPGGTSQAYRHNGTITGAELTKQLGTYAAAGQPTTTVSGGVVVAQPATSPVIVGGTYQAAPRYVYPAGGYSYPTYQLGGYPSINCVGPR